MCHSLARPFTVSGRKLSNGMSRSDSPYLPCRKFTCDVPRYSAGSGLCSLAITIDREL